MPAFGSIFSLFCQRRYFYQTQVWSLRLILSPFHSPTTLFETWMLWPWRVEMCKFPLIIDGEVVFDVDLSQLQNGFFTVATSSCQCFDLESSKLHMDFVKIGFVKIVIFISRPLPNKTKPKLDLDFKLVDWLKHSIKFMPWVLCAFWLKRRIIGRSLQSCRSCCNQRGIFCSLSKNSECVDFEQR